MIYNWTSRKLLIIPTDDCTYISNDDYNYLIQTNNEIIIINLNTVNIKRYNTNLKHDCLLTNNDAIIACDGNIYHNLTEVLYEHDYKINLMVYISNVNKYVICDEANLLICLDYIESINKYIIKSVVRCEYACMKLLNWNNLYVINITERDIMIYSVESRNCNVIFKTDCEIKDSVLCNDNIIIIVKRKTGLLIFNLNEFVKIKDNADTLMIPKEINVDDTYYNNFDSIELSIF